VYAVLIVTSAIVCYKGQILVWY